jgi:hypothetical protein
MLTKKLLTAPLLVAVLAAGATSPDAHAANGIKYEGTTKEGTEMSFTLDGTWIDAIVIRAPATCVSAQGGTRARVFRFDPPFKFRLGRTAKATDETSITRHYTMKTKGKRGKAITGSFEVNWSELDGISSADMKIFECIATASFKLKPKR